MSEIITSHVAMNAEGDIVYPGQGPNFDPAKLDASLAWEEADDAAEQRYEEHLQQARSGNFAGRNKLLAEAARLAGAANQSEGAAKRYAMGMADKIRGAAEAAERSIVERQKALELARIACRACPLKDFCVMDPEELVRDLSKTGKAGSSVRQRFSRRVEKSDNNHLCEDNLRSGRLPKQ